MSSKRSRYRELGLKLVYVEDNHSFSPKKPPMAKEKRDDGARDPIKLLLKEPLTQQRNEMMDNFSQILRQLPTSTKAPSNNSHFGGGMPFKVQINFDIPLFEG
jgi:hypothetical protein